MQDNNATTVSDFSLYEKNIAIKSPSAAEYIFFVAQKTAGMVIAVKTA